ncbi:hypothetical protein QN239_32965 [Mycolicibacterium sp. Y3]
MPSDDTTPVYGMPLEQVLIHVWFDGFTSGASTGCNLFLPADAADAKADDLVAAAVGSPELQAQVQMQVRERMTELMQQVMAKGPLPGVTKADIRAAADKNGPN